MKGINWAVLGTLLLNIVMYFIPDFPKEALIAVVVNGAVLVAYARHKWGGK